MSDDYIECPACGQELDSTKWEITCPWCLIDLARDGGYGYCRCSHRGRQHKYSQTGPKKCNMCPCSYFQRVNDFRKMESDEKFQGEFCKHVFIRKKPEGGEKLRYVCQGCNSIYVNCMPSYFAVVEDDVER